MERSETLGKSSWSRFTGAYLPTLRNNSTVRHPYNVCVGDYALRTSVAGEGFAVHKHLILMI